MDSLKNLKDKLALLDSMLSRMKTSHHRVRELKRSVYVLKSILKDQKNIKSPYGRTSSIVRFSVQ